MSLKRKCVITCALAGAGTFKEQNPAVPYGVDECIEEAVRAYEAGAAVVHIHARTPEGMGTEDPEILGPIVEGIRSRCPVLINLSTAVGAGKTPEQRISVVENFKPDLASLNTGTMNFALADRKSGAVLVEITFENTFEMLKNFALKMREAGTKPELEVYTPAHVDNVLLARKQGVFDEPLHFQYVFGVAGGSTLTPMSFAHFRSLTPKDASWSVCGVGIDSFRSNFMAVVNGGHIRVGLEDNIYVSGKTLAKGNHELVQKACEIVRLADREVATVDEARTLFNLPERG
ncbi:MAG: 3-keto-5-aminohexanoate cleavage protein [Deltaproteobacteria bacterium]|nr:3-keto-5-aminohexanoate cleavage protein [Deltaproteobacteria bacterium]